MRGHLWIVALELRVAGWILGVPSLLSTLVLTTAVFDFRQISAPNTSPYLDVDTYGLTGLLQNAALGVAKALGFLAGAAVWVVAALAAAAVAGTLIAVLLYLVGRGVQHHATWARILAVVIFLGLLVAAFGALPILPSSLAPFGWLLIGGSFYSLWVLVWRFRQ